MQSAILSAVQPGWVVFHVGSDIGTLALGAARTRRFYRLCRGFRRRLPSCQCNTTPREYYCKRVAKHSASSSRSGLVLRRKQNNSIPMWEDHAVARGGVEIEEYRPILGSGDLINVPVIPLYDFVASGSRVLDLIGSIYVEGGDMEALLEARNSLKLKVPADSIAEIHTRPGRRMSTLAHSNAYSASETVLGDLVPARLFAWPREQHPGPWPQSGGVE